MKKFNSQTIRDDLDALNSTIIKGNEMVANNIHPLLTSLKISSTAGVKVINDAHELCLILRKLDSALQEIKECLLLVGLVPVLDTVVPALRKVLTAVEGLLTPICKTLGPLDKDVLNPAAKVFNKIDVITSTLDNTLSEFSQQVPGYTHSITTIKALIDILELFEKLSSYTADDDPVTGITERIVTTINTAQSSMDSMYNTLLNTAQAGRSLLNILSSLSGLTSQISNIVETVKSSVENLFAISDALTKIKDIIVPLKWVLDAAKFIIEKLIEEPVNALLEYLQIQKTIDEVLKNITKPLNDSLTFIKNIEIYCPTSDINEIYSVINDQCVTTVNSCLKNINHTFEPFHLSNLASWRATLSELVHSSIKVSIGNDGMIILNNWSIQPSSVLRPSQL